MADTEDHSTKHIIQSLLVNVTIAAIKAVAARREHTACQVRGQSDGRTRTGGLGLRLHEG